LPIGTPMDNTQVYVLDEGRHLVPPGEPGQLYVAGEGTARGYIGRPDLTAERFVPNPFGAPDSVMYATGDLVRWDEAGRLRYLGRADDQVKIHGFRIEPGEIESVLARHPQVSQVAVRVENRDAGGGRIVAYAVPSDPYSTPDPAVLRTFLAERLPEYMVP